MKKTLLFLTGMMILSLVGCETTDMTTEINNQSTPVHTSGDNQEFEQENEKEVVDEKGLTKTKKLEVIGYINGIMDPLNADSSLSDEYLEQKANEVWADAEKKFNITEMDIINILFDDVLVKEYYDSKNNVVLDDKSEMSTTYDATLVNNGNKVMVAATEDFVSEFVKCVTNSDNDSISNMYNNGLISYVPNGTKVMVVDMGFSSTKVKILEGELKGLEVFTINECISMK